MDDLQREKDDGFSWDYLGDVPQKKQEVGDRYQTPEFGLAGQLFASVAKVAIDRLGQQEGESLLREAVEYFGEQRGRRIGERVDEQGARRTFKNWLIHTDVDTDRNFPSVPDLDDGDLVVEVTDCSFWDAAAAWGLEEYAGIYCKFADHTILKGYNPDIRLQLEPRGSSGEHHCNFRYITKEHPR